ncbi:hypothetical protein BBJ28_00010086 [Nothophytophthora sp. Chile5]|nr:hypothetical protein BBJ28_00010086 [Nothophytophthora sp. Chile5]
MATSPTESQRHVVTALDLTAASSGAGDASRPLQWVAVAACVFPELHTVSKAKRARKAGHLLLNGQSRVPTLTCAVAGDVMTYCNPEQRLPAVANHDQAYSDSCKWLETCKTQGLRVVYEHDGFAVVVKPVGIHVKGRGKRTVERALPLLLQQAHTPDGEDFVLRLPHAVHRLDYRVGGLLLVAKTRSMEVALAEQLERHSVSKRYRAILVGKVDDQLPVSSSRSSTVEAIVLPRTLQEIRDELVFLQDPIDGKLCLTAMRIASITHRLVDGNGSFSARYEWLTTVDLWPLTGRKHQLRIHTARLGHPIIGDDLYHDASCMATVAETDLDDAAPSRAVVRGMGLFLYSVGVELDDAHGSRRSFSIEEPNKFARFRHFCDLNWMRQARKQEYGTS